MSEGLMVRKVCIADVEGRGDRDLLGKCAVRASVSATRVPKYIYPGLTKSWTQSHQRYISKTSNVSSHLLLPFKFGDHAPPLVLAYAVVVEVKLGSCH